MHLLNGDQLPVLPENMSFYEERNWLAKILLIRSGPIFCARYTVNKICAVEEARLLEVKFYTEYSTLSPRKIALITRHCLQWLKLRIGYSAVVDMMSIVRKFPFSNASVTSVCTLLPQTYHSKHLLNTCNRDISEFSNLCVYLLLKCLPLTF